MREDLRRNRFRFILAEIELGSTFAKLALNATNPVKQQRNEKNARRAFDEAVRFTRKARLSTEERETVEIGVNRLRAALHLLNGHA